MITKTAKDEDKNIVLKLRSKNFILFSRVSKMNNKNELTYMVPTIEKKQCVCSVIQSCGGSTINSSAELEMTCHASLIPRWSTPQFHLHTHFFYRNFKEEFKTVLYIIQSLPTRKCSIAYRAVQTGRSDNNPLSFTLQ